jgi:hypothetical protein
MHSAGKKNWQQTIVSNKSKFFKNGIKILQLYTNFFANIYSEERKYYGEIAYAPHILITTLDINLSCIDEKKLEFFELSTEKQIENNCVPVNINTLSRQLNLPRETVKRKVYIMLKKNWLMRKGQYNLYISPNWLAKNKIILKKDLYNLLKVSLEINSLLNNKDKVPTQKNLLENFNNKFNCCTVWALKYYWNLFAKIYEYEVNHYNKISYGPIIMRVMGDINWRFLNNYTLYQRLSYNNKKIISEALGANINTVARGTGLPRETTKRKIALLIKKGWILKHSNQIYTSENWLRYHVPYALNEVNLILEFLKKYQLIK